MSRRHHSECTLRVVGYQRVSTLAQGESGIGLAAQEQAIRDACAARGWELVGLSEDAGFSGRDLRRPALVELMERLRRGQADALVVAKLDRLSRSMIDFTSVMAKGQKEGWHLIALDCAVDTTTAAGEAMANVLATFAQFERRLIAQRTADALGVLRSQGKVFGSEPFGFRAVDGVLVACPDQQRVLARMKRLRGRGLSYQAIAERLNKTRTPAKKGGRWHAMTVRGALLTAPTIGRSSEGVGV